MKKIIAVLVVIITFSSLFFFFSFMLKPEKKVDVIHNNKTYDVAIESSLLDKNEKKKVADRKKQILKEIDDINVQLAKTIEQDKIDSLADKKEKLVIEYQDLERGELNGKK